MIYCAVTTLLLSENEIPVAAQILRDGGLVAFRTETVYGLGALATSPASIKKIFTAKNRPAEKQLVWQFPNLRAACAYFGDAIDTAHKNLFKAFPHGLTVIISNGIGVRIPSDPIARRVLRECAVPLVVTSANTSGNQSPTTWQQVKAELDGKIDAIVMSKPCQLGVPSTIVKITTGKIEILRQGALTPEILAKKTGLPVN